MKHILLLLALLTASGCTYRYSYAETDNHPPAWWEPAPNTTVTVVNNTPYTLDLVEDGVTRGTMHPGKVIAMKFGTGINHEVTLVVTGSDKEGKYIGSADRVFPVYRYSTGNYAYTWRVDALYKPYH